MSVDCEDSSNLSNEENNMKLDYEIIPAILVRNYEEFVRDLQAVEPYVRTVQLDVIDGEFAPNIAYGDPDDMEHCFTPHPKEHLGVCRKMDLSIEAHLMVNEPDVAKWATSGLHRIILHIESFANHKKLQDSIKFIRSQGVQVGLALKPSTKVEQVLAYLPGVDYVLILTVEPGFSGQEFMPKMLEKVRELRKKFPSMDIEVDGGINADTILKAKDAGANKFSVGSAIFSAMHPKNVISELKGMIGQEWKV